MVVLLVFILGVGIKPSVSLSPHFLTPPNQPASHPYVPYLHHIFIANISCYSADKF